MRSRFVPPPPSVVQLQRDSIAGISCDQILGGYHVSFDRHSNTLEKRLEFVGPTEGDGRYAFRQPSQRRMKAPRNQEIQIANRRLNRSDVALLCLLRQPFSFVQADHLRPVRQVVTQELVVSLAPAEPAVFVGDQDDVGALRLEKLNHPPHGI
jgi:hypothetical protein